MSPKKRPAPVDPPKTNSKSRLEPVEHKWLVGAAQVIDRHVYFKKSTPLCEAPDCSLGTHEHAGYRPILSAAEMKSPCFDVPKKCKHAERFVTIKSDTQLVESLRESAKVDTFFHAFWDTKKQKAAFEKYQTLCERQVEFSEGARLASGYYSSQTEWAAVYDKFAPFEYLPLDVVRLILEGFLTYNYWCSGSQFATLAAVCKQWYAIVNAWNFDDKTPTGKVSFYAAVALRVGRGPEDSTDPPAPEQQPDSPVPKQRTERIGHLRFTESTYVPSESTRLSSEPTYVPSSDEEQESCDEEQESCDEKQGPPHLPSEEFLKQSTKKKPLLPVFLTEMLFPTVRFTVSQIQKTILPLWPLISGISDEIENTYPLEVNVRNCLVRILARADKNLVSMLFACTSFDFLRKTTDIPLLLSGPLKLLSRSAKFTVYCHLISSPVIRAATTKFSDPAFHSRNRDESNLGDYGFQWQEKIAKEALKYNDWPEMNYLSGMLKKWVGDSKVLELIFQSGYLDFQKDRIRLGENKIKQPIWNFILSKSNPGTAEFIEDHWNDLNANQHAFFIQKSTVSTIKPMLEHKNLVPTPELFFVSALGHNRTAALFKALPKETKNSLFPDWVKYLH